MNLQLVHIYIYRTLTVHTQNSVTIIADGMTLQSSAGLSFNKGSSLSQISVLINFQIILMYLSKNNPLPFCSLFQFYMNTQHIEAGYHFAE